MQPWNWKCINKCGRNKLQFHFHIGAVSALGVLQLLLLLLLFDDKVVWIADIVAFFWRRATKLDLEVVKVACKKHFTKFILFSEGTLCGEGNKLFLVLGPLFGECRTLWPNPTLNLVLETMLVFLGHQSFQGWSKGEGGGGLGESREGNSSCTCNPCEGSLKQIGSCKAKFGPTQHVYNNLTPNPISHFNWLCPKAPLDCLVAC